MNQPWTSVTICDRLICFKQYHFSLRTKFLWKDEAESKLDKLIEESNLPGTLLTVQLWNLENGQNVLKFKPIASSNQLDLIGQSRVTEQTKMFFATDNKILVQMKDNRFLIFDDQGYFMNECPPCLRQSSEILLESV